jgi:oligoribonuclease
MPRLAAHLNYRIVDVSSVRELAKRWYPAELRKAPRKANAHTALADIRESLAELRWLRRAVFKPVKH